VTSCQIPNDLVSFLHLQDQNALLHGTLWYRLYMSVS
jgi:hypothetical protein